jgi:hypothetical protein
MNKEIKKETDTRKGTGYLQYLIAVVNFYPIFIANSFSICSSDI